MGENLLKNQIVFEEKLQQKQHQTLQMIQHINLLGLEQNRLNDEISKKENIVEA